MFPFRKETYETYGKDWLFIPGVETVADALNQLSWGAHLIKFFNSEIYGGPLRIKALQGPGHGIFPILVTGGITTDKVLPYLGGGALVLGAGFEIILGERYQEMQKAPDKTYICARLEEYVSAVAEARAQLGHTDWAEIQEPDELLKATNRYFSF